MTLMLRAEEIRWSLDDPEQPAARHVAQAVSPPSGLTASRADLVTWWRWRFAGLENENARVGDLLVQAIGEAQGYRQTLQAAIDAMNDLTDTTRRQRQTIAHLRDERRHFRERDMAVST